MTPVCIGAFEFSSAMSWLTSPHRTAQLLTRVYLITFICGGQQQQRQLKLLPLDAGCTMGPQGLTQNLSSLTTQQLAEGGLAPSVTSTWDFGVSAGFLQAASGRNITLACITALNASISRPSGSDVFLQPTALDLSNATGLQMENVLLRTTSCSNVLEYQTYFCSSYNVSGSISLWQGAVHFSTWQDGFTTLRNVTLTCPSAADAPQPPCWLAAVRDAQELLDAFVSYLDAVKKAADVTIVLAADVVIRNSSWPDTPVKVPTNVQLVGSSRLNRPVLDFQLLVTLWDLLPSVNVSLINLTCINLAPSYISPAFTAATYSLFTHRVWAFRRTERQLDIRNSTLVVPVEELAYITHWIKYLASPVPEDRAQAAWLNLTLRKPLEVNDSGVYYDLVQAHTATYTSVRLTDSLAGPYPLLPISVGLQQLLTDDVPLSSVRQVMNTSDMLIALTPSTMQPDGQGRRWVLLVANISLADADATVLSHQPPSGSINGSGTANSSASATIQLPGEVVVGVSTGLWAVRLDFGGRRDVLGLSAGSTLVLRGLALGTLPTRSTAYDSKSPLDTLASPLWGFALTDAAGGIILENCTILVSAAELRLLQQCLLPPATAPAPTFDTALMSAVRTFFLAARMDSYSASYLRLVSGVTQRYSFTHISFRTPVSADGEGGVPDVVAPSSRSSGSGLEGWRVGVVVGGVVGGVMVLAAVAAALLFAVRQRHRFAAKDDAPRRQEAYEKYLRSGGGGVELREGVPGGPGGSGSCGVVAGSLDLANPSNELTNSSQVLRPDARRSDLEAARLKATGSGTASASASGGIGPAGRSMSITGVTSHDTSSAAALPLGGSGGAQDAVVTAHCSNPSTSDGVRQQRTSQGSASGSIPPAAAAAAAPATAAGALAHSTSPVTDSFERPPSNTALGQHGPAGRHAQRLASVAMSGSGAGSSVANQSQSVLASGGAAALEHMHQMIQVLGRDFNDRQLEVNGLLGKGAHGTVYRGTWRGLPVAVKSMVFSSDNSTRQHGRVLMEAAISSNLMHPNIVTTYSYELREVEHELASISPELAREGGGWRLLIIQEYCDGGPLRRLVDCGFFLIPPKPSTVRPKLKLPSVGLLRKDSPSGEGSVCSATRGDAPTSSCTAVAAAGGAASSGSRGSSGSSSVNGNGSSRGSPRTEAVTQPPPAIVAARAGASSSTQGPVGLQASPQHPQQRPTLEPVPSDVPGRPTSSLQAAKRYVEAALMIARGLQHIHDKNIVHGDLNPNNVLLMRAPGTPLGFHLKVADFGLSVRMVEGESHMSNLFQGSPYYCAPEVFLSGRVGKSADIYSLGIVLWELQNGTRPLWRAGVRLRTYPSINTAELDFGVDTPPRYVRLARDCFHGSKDARPKISMVVDTLVGIKAELDLL